MKKVLLLAILFLPIIGFGQIDLATWTLTSGPESVVSNSSYLAASDLTKGAGIQNAIAYTASGATVANWNQSNLTNVIAANDYYQVTIAPKAGEGLYISNVTFSHRSIGNNDNQAPTNYAVRALKGNTLVSSTQGTMTYNTDNNNTVLNVGTYLGENETLTIRFYAWDGNDNNGQWRINANSLKIKGFQRLCGDYVINNTSSVVPFKTLTTAVEAVNNLGVSCATRFLLDENQTTASQYVINQFTGTSATNTLTILPNTGQTVSISGSLGNSSSASIVKLNGADYVIFDGSNNGTSARNMTITNTSTSNYNNYTEVHSAIFWIASNATNAALYNKIKNINFTGSNSDATTSTSAGIVLSSSTNMQTQESVSNSSTEITNNVFTKMKFGVWALGNASASNQNLLVNQNVFGSTTSTSAIVISAIKLSNVENAIINKNEIIGVNLASNSVIVSGITLYDKSTNTTISQNKISNVKNTGGGIAKGIDINTSILAQSNLTIVNNFISNVTSSANSYWDTVNAGHGIYITQGRDVKIYYNTVNLDTYQNVSSAALFISSGSELNVRNNMFLNTQAGGRRFAVYSNAASSALTSIDYNNYHVNSTGNAQDYKLGYINGDRATLADWKTGTGKDLNSQNVMPSFVSSTNFHLLSESAPNDVLKGTPITGITKDIDEDTRNTTTPSMGADEFKKCGSAANSIYSNGSWSLDPTDTAAEVNSSFALSSNLALCSLTVKQNQIVTVPADKTLTVYGNVVVEAGGKIIVENNGSFVQVDNNATYTGAATSFTLKRYTQPVRRYDFTYWSSPVAEANWTLYDLSPNTLGDKYYSYNPAGAWQIHYNGAENMKTCKGYLVRAPQTFEINVQQIDENTKFIGIPNNGVKTFTTGGAGSFNLIGNPYPSAMDADKFILANQNSITGALYFWTHNTPVTNYVYSAGDYATYTLVGGVRTQQTGNGGVQPTGKIASGQAFFVERQNNTNAVLTYNNDMRVTGNNNQFFKPAPTEADDVVYKHRFWLNVSNASNAYSEMLVGYMTGATDGFDNAYDGKTFGGNVIALYSKLDANNLVVQAKSLPFDENDVIPVGYKTTVAGEFTINLNEFDGLFADQDLFLVDNLENTITNLKEMDYIFTTAVGTFDSRFEIKFINTTLGIDTPTIDKNSIVIFRNGSQIEIKSKDQSIDQVTVYDLLGKVIFEKNKINTQNFSTAQLNVSNQVVLVKVITDTKAEVVKKIIMN